MNNRNIKKVAVLGSGVMGSRIACHFANVGCEVLLLDIVPKEGNDKNKIVNDALAFALKNNPSPIYDKKFASRIRTGNFDDDLPKIKDCDWIIEVVIERLDIKQQVLANVEKYRTPGTLITTNTSGIPIHAIAEGRSDDFKKHFCGTHFFNPPRYLQLLEIIPGPGTDPAVLSFLEDYGQHILGKVTVLCKDTPAFIANRIGVFGIMGLFHLVEEMGLTVEEVDRLTGPVLGRPKSATFRTADVVGLDTLVKVAQGVKDNCPKDEQNALFTIPGYLQQMVDKNMLGSKTGKGFFFKDRAAKGEIMALDLKTLEYRAQVKPKFATMDAAKKEDDLVKRMPILYTGTDKAGDFYRKSFHGLFAYVSHRIPEITDDLYKIDDALRAGFGWELGPFELWDAVGVKTALDAMNAAGMTVAPWVAEMLKAGNTSFYKTEGGKRMYYDAASKSYKPIPRAEGLIVLADLPESSVVWKNSQAVVRDLGDGILSVSWTSKMNTIGAEVIQGLNKAIDLAEAGYKGLVVYNDGALFSAGANVGMIFMMAVEQEYEDLDMAIRTFQNTMMRMRHSSIPVVAAPHQLCLGGGTELCMHADKVVAHAETYMGLVEFGVGVIPGGGGTKEFALRLSDELKEGDIRINRMRERFLTIGQAKVSTSGEEAFDLGYLRPGQDEVIVSRAHQLAHAKACALDLWSKGYTKPPMRRDIKVLGKEGLGIVYVGANSMQSGNYISEHDALISEKLGYVLCGGDLSEITEVSEQYLLDLERKAFLELCMQKKTLERLQSIITTGKVLRN
ncbi:MAG: enoyl-CoA hydratase/isomerase family protein [Flavobacteriales bacterium]|nr:enoyl-CoA hydratase/isomerase family protein [Flavobacteriales bacterium]MBK6943491.1 enoyl-CoA hydratase/isomerase family protein [Flavobacteriales bacterium]MBK9535971.1 enoyl-CoA hydratase/isomerase family protein [Flavobacteriales bacterium]MBP9138853.1 enoyl-CoA hydratase/isomerase family protein [Flavobacteriales bacterium]HQX36848.1 3-hydroxyacyl-CoA dehydrogenase NAD-binding domain-containing protein [Flavobacteriales bacterium]